MAGTVVTTEVLHTSLKSVKFAFTTTAGGIASATTTGVYDGRVLGFLTVPTGGGYTDAWDLVLNDEDSVDVLRGFAANRASATTQYVSIASVGLGFVAGDKLNLVISGTGASKSGTVIVYLR